MGIFSWIILGLIAGYVGGKFVARPGQGLVANLVLGIFGAIVGGIIANFFGLGGVSGVNIYSRASCKTIPHDARSAPDCPLTPSF